MTKMADKAFVDTNVMLRATFSGMNLHEECKSFLERLLVENTDLWINNQVIREFCVRATHENTFMREQAPRPHFGRALYAITTLSDQFKIADEGASVRGEFLRLMREFRIRSRNLHDVNIVATMLVEGIDTLITTDSVFRRFEDLITVSSPTDQVA